MIINHDRFDKLVKVVELLTEPLKRISKAPGFAKIATADDRIRDLLWESREILKKLIDEGENENHQ